jgi:hypothetical protein
MRRVGVLAISLLATISCGEQGENDEPIPLDKVPPSVVKVASDQLPGVKFETAYKETKGGEQIYELRGKTKEGKIREVEVSADGKVIQLD